MKVLQWIHHNDSFRLKCLFMTTKVLETKMLLMRYKWFLFLDLFPPADWNICQSLLLLLLFLLQPHVFPEAPRRPFSFFLTLTPPFTFFGLLSLLHCCTCPWRSHTGRGIRTGGQVDLCPKTSSMSSNQDQVAVGFPLTPLLTDTYQILNGCWDKDTNLFMTCTLTCIRHVELDPLIFV